MPKVALGIDLGTYNFGIAAVNSFGELLASRQVKVEKGDIWSRIKYVCDQIISFIDSEKLSGVLRVVVVEKIRLFHRGSISIDAIRDLARLQGAIGYIFTKRGIKIIDVHVQHWRKSVIGDGKVGKEEVVKWAKSLAPDRDLGTDEAEAIALAWFGILSQKLRRKCSISTRRTTKHGTHQGSRKRPMDRRNMVRSR